MIGSSVKYTGEVEYDKQNWLQHQKTQAWPKNSKWGLNPIATVHKSVHIKKFPTKRFLKTVDSSVRNPGKFEYDKQNWLRHQKTQV